MYIKVLKQTPGDFHSNNTVRSYTGLVYQVIISDLLVFLKPTKYTFSVNSPYCNFI